MADARPLLPDDLPPTGFFGPSLMRKEWEVQVDPPIGAVCIDCSELVDEGDIGTINPFGNVVQHYECTMRHVVGSVGHQKGKCSCFGGTEEDPPGMTRRQAAKAALEYWNTHKTIRVEPDQK